MRLNRYLALATGLSRRAADTAIQAGEATVDNMPGELGQEINDEIVRYQGQIVTPQSYQYLVVHKPVGYITSRASQGGAPTIYDLLPAQYTKLKPAGRLDRDSHGLVLLTNDGELAHVLTHPSTHHIKRYRLVLDRPLSRADQKLLASGVKLDDGPSRPKLISMRGRVVELELSEGRNRQLRRTMTAIGYNVGDLERIALGKLTTSALASGKWRLVGAKDIL